MSVDVYRILFGLLCGLGPAVELQFDLTIFLIVFRWPVNGVSDQLTSRPVDQFTSLLVYRFNSLPVYRFTSLPVYQLPVPGYRFSVPGLPVFGSRLASFRFPVGQFSVYRFGG